MIEFVRLYKNTDFKGAVRYLSDLNAPSPAVKALSLNDVSLELSAGSEPEKEQGEKPAESGPEQKGLLKRVAEDYHRALLASHKAQDYLESRCLFDPVLIRCFQIGFCDGSLINKISDSQKEVLKKLGLLV